MRVPPFHWWRTVVFLIPAISVYTIVLGTASLVSTVVDRRGYVAHGCARAWSWLILATTGVAVQAKGSTASSRAAPTSSCRTTRASTISRCCSPPFLGSCASSRRSPSAAFRSSAGTCAGAATCSWTAGGRTVPASSAGGRRSWTRDCRCIIFPEGTRSVDGRVRRSRREVPARGGSGPANRADFAGWQPVRDEEGTTDDVPRPRAAARCTSLSRRPACP